MASVLFFVLNLLGFFGCTHIFTVHLVYSRVLRVVRAFTIGFPLGCRESACVEVMTTLHGSASSLRRRVEGCIPLEGTITPTMDPFKRPTLVFLEPPLTF